MRQDEIAKTLFLSDLDGTLLRSDQTLSEYTCSVIGRLAGAGVHFSYATARSIDTAAQVTRGLNVGLPVIVHNGAFILDSVTRRPLWSAKFTREEEIEVYGAFLDHGLFPLTYAQLMAAYRGIDPKLFEMARVYRVAKKDVLFRICVPQMLPSVFAQAGANLSLAVKVMVSAEVLAGTFLSIGGMMQDAAVYLQIADMFALTIVMLAVGGLLEFALGNLNRITDRWSKGRGGAEVRR